VLIRLHNLNFINIILTEYSSKHDTEIALKLIGLKICNNIRIEVVISDPIDGCLVRKIMGSMSCPLKLVNENDNNTTECLTSLNGQKLDIIQRTSMNNHRETASQAVNDLNVELKLIQKLTGPGLIASSFISTQLLPELSKFTFTNIDLSDQQLGYDGAKMFSSYLNSNFCPIQILNISNTHLSGSGLVLIITGLLKASQLKCLNASSNIDSEKDAYAAEAGLGFAKLLKSQNVGLRELDISSNHFTSAGIFSIGMHLCFIHIFVQFLML
jgi:hypothetical protein